MREFVGNDDMLPHDGTHTLITVGSAILLKSQLAASADRPIVPEGTILKESPTFDDMQPQNA